MVNHILLFFWGWMVFFCHFSLAVCLLILYIELETWTNMTRKPLIFKEASIVMEDDKEMPDAGELRNMLAALIQQQSSKSYSKRRSRPESDYKIVSVQIPTRVKDRRETCKVTIACEVENLRTADDLLDLLVQLEDNGIVPDWWPDKSYDRGGGGRGYNSRGGDDYRRRR